MRSNIKKIYIAQYFFLFATHLLGTIFFAFILDMFDSQVKKDNKYPGIDIKEFR